MSDFLYRVLSGWIEVSVSGRQVEHLISQVAEEGYRLWDVQRGGDTYTFFATLSAIPSIQRVAEEKGLAVTHLRRGGLPIEWRKSQRRPFLWVGVLTAIVIVFYATSRIWVVDVVTPNISAKAREQLVLTAEGAGLSLGSVRAHLDVQAIRTRMIRALPQYAWIGISVHGVLASIQVVPLVLRPRLHTFSSIVASHAGEITQVLVYMGAPEVSVGEIVHKGQTLISGSVSAPSRIQPDGAQEPQRETVMTPAEGDVFANVAHGVEVFQPFMQQTAHTTSKVFVQAFLFVADRGPWQYQGFGQIPFHHYQTRRVMTQVQYRGVNLPIKLLKIVYNETIITKRRLSRARALASAAKRATEQLAHTLHDKGPVVREIQRARWTTTGVWVQVVWIVNQNIAQPKPRR